jgi:hypothetical protein
MAVDTLHLTALEEFYLTLLKTGSLPNYQDGCPEIALTKHLLATEAMALASPDRQGIGVLSTRSRLPEIPHTSL